MENNKDMKVFYDGNCYVCDFEMGSYKKRCGEKQKIEFVDITSEGFDAKKEGLDPEDVKKSFHVKIGDEKISGVEAFINIWDRIGPYNILGKVARKPVIRPLLECSYKLFVVIRPFLPRKD